MNFLDQHASAIQALAALATLALTAALVWVTWRYVQLTGDLVEQNREAAEIQEARERTQRRRLAVPLRRLTLSLLERLQKAHRPLPTDVTAVNWNWRQEIDEIKQLALVVGSGTDRMAQAAGECLENWYEQGKLVPDTRDPERSMYIMRAMTAWSGATTSLENLGVRARQINEDES